VDLRQADANGVRHGRTGDLTGATDRLKRDRHSESSKTYVKRRSTRRPAVRTTTYLGSGEASRHRQDYRPEWLDNLADDVTLEGSVLTGIAEGPEAIRAILGFARTLYEYQEFNFVGPYGEHGFVEDYTSVVRGEPIGSVVVVRFNEAGQAARIVVNHRPLRSVLLWSQLMGEHFAGTRYATYFLSHGAAEALAMGTR
jgi:hypothetical protein